MSVKGVAVNRANLIQAIRDCGGCVAHICRVMNISTGTFYVYKKTDPEIGMVLKEAREVRNFEIETEEELILDKCYQAIKEMIDEREPAAVIYTLSTLGRQRNPKWGKAPIEEQKTQTTATITFVTEDVDRKQIPSAVVPERLSDGDEDEEESVSSLS